MNEQEETTKELQEGCIMYVGKVKWYESFWSVLICFILAPLSGYLSLFPALFFLILRIRKEIKRMIINKQNNLPLNHPSPYEEQNKIKDDVVTQNNLTTLSDEEFKRIAKEEIRQNIDITISRSEIKSRASNNNYNYTKIRKLVNDFTVLDFETTGLSPENDCIIQVAAVKYRDFKKVDEFVMFVNPLIPIPKRITDINGISEDDVKDSPTIDKILPQLIEFIGEDIIVAHNASFDMKFLLAKMQANNIEYRKFKTIDTLSLARKYIDFTKNHKLETLKSFLKLNHLSSHEALHDCYVTAELYKYCYEESLVKN